MVRFNSKAHKDKEVKMARALGEDSTADVAASTVCMSAAATSPKQMGHIYIVEGNWRPPKAKVLVKFCPAATPSYTCLVLLNRRAVGVSPFFFFFFFFFGRRVCLG